MNNNQFITIRILLNVVQIQHAEVVQNKEVWDFCAYQRSLGASLRSPSNTNQPLLPESHQKA
jgi:hypothetical protein